MVTHVFWWLQSFQTYRSCWLHGNHGSEYCSLIWDPTLPTNHFGTWLLFYIFVLGKKNTRKSHSKLIQLAVWSLGDHHSKDYPHAPSMQYLLYIYDKFWWNVGKYTIHGASGMFETLFIMEEIARTSPNSSGHRQIGLPLTAGRFRVKVCTPPTKMFNCIAPIQRNTLPETNKLQLKMDGWKTTLLLGWPNFRGYVSSREGNHLPFFLKSWKFHSFFCSDTRVSM